MANIPDPKVWFTAAYWTPEKSQELAQFWAVPILICCALYAPTIVFIQRMLRNRPPLKLKWLNVFWNLTISMLSGLAVVLMLYDCREVFATIYGPIMTTGGPAGRAAWTLFALTKSLEFGDTYLLCLRKRGFIFLHYFHHVTVALVAWHGMLVGTNFSHYPSIVNLSVHFVMYGYYALAIMFPANRYLRRIRPMITGCQLIQMFFGMWFTANVPFRAARGFYVEEGEWSNAVIGTLLYICFAYLFAKFFIDQYVKQWESTRALTVATVYVGAAVGIYVAVLHGGLIDFVKLTTVAVVTFWLYRRCLDYKDASMSHTALSVLNTPLAVLASTSKSTDVHSELLKRGSLQLTFSNFANLFACVCVPFAVGAQRGSMRMGCLFGCTRWVVEWHLAGRIFV